MVTLRFPLPTERRLPCPATPFDINMSDDRGGGIGGVTSYTTTIHHACYSVNQTPTNTDNRMCTKLMHNN